MEPAEPVAELYDYLYRDSNRFDSFYAQMFGGTLKSYERGETARSATDKTGKASVSVVAGELKSTEESQE
jgi:hypothetical protein